MAYQLDSVFRMFLAELFQLGKQLVEQLDARRVGNDDIGAILVHGCQPGHFVAFEPDGLGLYSFFEQVFLDGVGKGRCVVVLFVAFKKNDIILAEYLRGQLHGFRDEKGFGRIDGIEVRVVVKFLA